MTIWPDCLKEIALVIILEMILAKVQERSYDIYHSGRYATLVAAIPYLYLFYPLIYFLRKITDRLE